MNRVTHRICAGLLCLGLVVPASAAAEPPEAIVRLRDVTGLRLQWQVHAVDDRIIGSQYDRTGNAFEIVQLDIESGTVTRLVDGVREGR